MEKNILKIDKEVETKFVCLNCFYCYGMNSSSCPARTGFNQKVPTMD